MKQLAALTARRLRGAGLLAMANAIMTIPWFIMTFMLGEKSGLWPKVANGAMQVTSTAIFVFVVLTLRILLNRRHSFQGINVIIDWMVKANIVITVVSLAGIASREIAEATGVLALILIVPLGVLQLVMGLRLQQLPNDLNGLLRPFCYLNMITGISLASIILIPVGVIIGAVCDIMLGTIFFQAAAAGPLIDTEA
jgi:hypothetical protein